MVGRELLTICPDGEDHRGHDRGDTIGVGDGGMKVRAWRKFTVRKRRMNMVDN